MEHQGCSVSEISELQCDDENEYDIFLSFRGEDTRHTFTGYLYDALVRKGINTFMDDENLRIGEQIRPQLVHAIQASKISIVVLSENYAASTWCLDELLMILKCKDENKQLVFPIFYKVEPSDVRFQRNSYGEAMTKHENRFGNDSNKVKQWRDALFHISILSGHHLKEGYEFKFIQHIVSKAISKVLPKQLHIEEHVVGLGFLVKKMKWLLDIDSKNSTHMLGIHGTGGIGKTTLAKVLYNSICNQFEAACFLFNIRETSSLDKGQLRLQQILLSEILEEGRFELSSVNKGISTIKQRLYKKRVLLVLDDVDNINQLKELAGGCDWFGSGSRIVITTRDKSLLVAHRVHTTYEMRVLNDHQSLELFCQNAFKRNHSDTGYEELSNRAIRYAKGLPLALKVIGANLFGNKDLDVWKSALDKYENNPHNDIQSILKISYDSLERNEKDIFLDIACFFNGQRLDYVKRILHGCDFFPEDGIKILVDKSLLTIEYDCLRMHHLIQEMGREIVKQEAPKEAAERSRLWFHEDILEVLTQNTGSSKIEGIKLDHGEEVNRTRNAFEKMRKLRILVVQNSYFLYGPINLPNQLRLLDWKGYPSRSFHPDFYPKKIAAFNLSCSALVLDMPFPTFEHLMYMNFSYCHSITKFPDVSGAKNLRELRLDGCKKLVKVDESVGFLPNLVHLSASGCSHLRSFLPRICLPSLEYLSLSLCRRLTHLPDIAMGKMDKPLKINLRQTAIKELPRSFSNLTGLNHVDMTSCKGIQYLPIALLFLPNFVSLKIGGCSQLRELFQRPWPYLETLHFNSASLCDEDLHMIIQSLPKLKELNVSSNHFVSFPDCIKECTCLTSLDVSYCVKLEEIPELSSSIQKVDARHCNSLTTKTSSMLWSQLLREEINRLEIVMPKTEIPEWFDYQEEGGNIIFWVRGKFPDVALAFVFEKVKYDSVGVQLLIEGEDVHVHGQHQQYIHNFNIAEDHMLLFDVRVFFSAEERNGVDARLGHEDAWKSVHVKFDTEMTVRIWGVYVYKQKTKMDAIQFTCPHSWIPSLSRTIEKDEEKEEKPSREYWSDGIEEVSRLESHVSNSQTEVSRSESHVSNSQTASHAHTWGHCSIRILSSTLEKLICCGFGGDGLESYTPRCARPCSPCCIWILSTLKKLICCNAKSRKRLDITSGFGGFEEGGGGSGFMGYGDFKGPDERLTKMMEEGLESLDTHIQTSVEGSSNFTKVEHSEDGDNISPYVDTQMQLPFFSESLQTVVGNLQRVMTVSSDDDEVDSVSSLEGNSFSAKVPASPLWVPTSPSELSMSLKLSELDPLHLNLSKVARATQNFSESLQIGEGGFGTVYKAELEDGMVVAVKRAKREQFESLGTEFKSEVELLAKINHRNLVKLLRYIDEGNERILVTEFVPNGTLREHLDGRRERILDFNQRLEIAADVANGLIFLHHDADKEIIHGDLKSSNILLTKSMEAKVADFGFAKLDPTNIDQTHTSTKVKGTFGYLDPEYVHKYKLTPESDVYSFGILLLEIVTGRDPLELKKPLEETDILSWALGQIRQGSFVELVDPLMKGAVEPEFLRRMFDLAFDCAERFPEDRPHMRYIARDLWSIRADYLKRRGWVGLAFDGFYHPY